MQLWREPFFRGWLPDEIPLIVTAVTGVFDTAVADMQESARAEQERQSEARRKAGKVPGNVHRMQAG